MTVCKLPNCTIRTIIYYCIFAVMGLLFFCVPTSSSLAFNAILEEFPDQYEVIVIENPEVEQLILGELKDAPEMFEIVSETPFTLTAEIRAIPDSSGATNPELSGIIIKQKEIRGVEEIARLNSTDSEWTGVTDKSTGLSYQAGGYYSEQVEAGTYRIEVSSPNNQGKYLLQIGNQKDSSGYFASLSDVKLVYEFYGLSTVRMFSSPYVHYPVGIIVLMGLIVGTWFWQRKQKRHA